MIDYIIKTDFLKLRAIDLDFLNFKKYGFQCKQTTTASLVGLLTTLWYIRRAVRLFYFRKVRSFKSLLTSNTDKYF